MIKNLLLGLILGLTLAALIVFARDQFDDAIRVPEDVEHKLALPLLGVIPQGPGDDPDQQLLDPKSPISEAYNSLRSSLLYSTADGMPSRLMVTSAQASEGKTTTSIAIATGLARMGKRVLLIDADMRRPSLHRRLALGKSTGLSSLLTSRDSLADHAVPSAHANLMILPAGPIPPSPTELMSTPRLHEILDEADQQYDVIMLDTPPVLGLADAPLISAMVGGVVFVVEADRGRHGALKAALRRLRTMRPVILGAVLNKFDTNKAGNRYSEYYGNEYYQYGHGDET